MTWREYADHLAALPAPVLAILIAHRIIDEWPCQLTRRGLVIFRSEEDNRYRRAIERGDLSGFDEIQVKGS